jgi:hypothetical protein
VSFAAPLQSRVVLVLGLLAAVAFAAFMLGRGALGGSSDETATATPAPASHARPATKPATSPVRPAKAAPKPKPTIVLNPGLPANLARALRKERVVVAAVWAPAAGDTHARAQAAAGAHQARAGFVTINVLAEKQARALEKLAGPVSDPSVLIVRRPGVVANRFDGFADAATVAQAAHLAGAR